MPDFWRNSGFHLLERDAAGRLRVTDDFLRAYYLRPEIHPVEESGPLERELHAALMAEPRLRVTDKELKALQDPDARDNYRLLLRFRDRLLDAGTVEGAYMALFKGAIDVPPMFIDQLAHVILRNVLDGSDDRLGVGAAECFFREPAAARSRALLPREEADAQGWPRAARGSRAREDARFRPPLRQHRASHRRGAGRARNRQPRRARSCQRRALLGARVE